jgi:hypothetical protein
MNLGYLTYYLFSTSVNLSWKKASNFSPFLEIPVLVRLIKRLGGVGLGPMFRSSQKVISLSNVCGLQIITMCDTINCSLVDG